MIRKSKHKSMGKPSINIPGKALLRFVEYGTPKVPGVYFIYYKPKQESALGSTFPTASFNYCVFDGKKWSNNNIVLAFIGPLPVLTLDEITEQYEKEELSLHVYCVGTLSGAVQGKWKQGPFHERVHLSCAIGEPGDYGFEVNQRTTLPKPVSYYSKKADKWLKLKNPSKVINKMKTLKKRGKEPIVGEKYAVCTIQQMIDKKYTLLETPMEAFGVVAEKGNYIFEISKDKIKPTYQWNKGWGGLSFKKIRAIRKRIGEL